MKNLNRDILRLSKKEKNRNGNIGLLKKVNKTRQREKSVSKQANPGKMSMPPDSSDKDTLFWSPF